MIPSRLVTNAGGREGNARVGGRRERGAGGELGGRDVPGRTIRGTLRSAPRARTGTRRPDGRRPCRCGWTRRVATNCSTPPRGSTRRARRRPSRAVTRGASSRARRRVARGASQTPNARRALRGARPAGAKYLHRAPTSHVMYHARTRITFDVVTHRPSATGRFRRIPRCPVSTRKGARVKRNCPGELVCLFVGASVGPVCYYSKGNIQLFKLSGLTADRYPIDRRSNRRSTAR